MALKTTLEDTQDRLEALLTYANSVTGAEDTSVGDAIETLANGYGQGGGGLTPPSWCNVETVAIGQNSVTNGATLKSYFTTNYPNFVLAILKEEPSVENHVLEVERADVFFRWRNNSVNAQPTNSAYDARLIEGTHYDVYTYE